MAQCFPSHGVHAAGNPGGHRHRRGAERTVILGFTGADEAQRLRGVAERIQVRLELARESALQRNREWGVHVQRNAYRFVEFDPMTGKWVAQQYRPFLADGLDAAH